MRSLALLLLAWPALAAAYGGSQVTWLGGTLPFDTVPRLEADPKFLLRAGSGGPELGAEVGAGLCDRLMLAGQWVSAPDGGSDGHAEARFKLLREPRHGFGLAAAAGWALPEGGAAEPYGTLIAGWEGFDSCLTGNLSWIDADHHPAGALGLWGPYLTYVVRPGLELGLDPRAAGTERWVLPQLALNFPGDLSLDLGVRFSDATPGGWRVHARLSYELFPNP